ncbi:MAG TPA: glutaredoxin family protein [Dissulfurispiraceae bacterium]
MQPRVKIYALSTCIHCKSTKRLLKDNSVAYECIEVDLLAGAERDNAIEEVKKINPECSFPTIIIGDKIIVGFKEKELREMLGL